MHGQIGTHMQFQYPHIFNLHHLDITYDLKIKDLFFLSDTHKIYVFVY
jgi:hypothetical protein